MTILFKIDTDTCTLLNCPHPTESALDVGRSAVCVDRPARARSCRWARRGGGSAWRDTRCGSRRARSARREEPRPPRLRGSRAPEPPPCRGGRSVQHILLFTHTIYKLHVYGKVWCNFFYLHPCYKPSVKVSETPTPNLLPLLKHPVS